ncbi:myelin expression factor 2 [Ictalurus punctatus]|uniref:Myelin expression factor 2 n=1 Tax=Ictalurus punctatus TaxID=7998 RepID=A0A9F7RD15_ICTPU|nr:myelin expression factor 2 [Ictalurus punctatus]
MAEDNSEFGVTVKLEESPDASPIEEDAETPQDSTNGVKTEEEDSQKDRTEGKEKSSGSRKSGRYHPYKDRHGGSGDRKSSQRNRVFISNIPYDMKWQAIKDLMREKVGEVTYVELFKDAEGKSRVSAVEAVNSASSLMCSPVTRTHSSLSVGYMSDLVHV